jgi:hypothetical protein
VVIGVLVVDGIYVMRRKRKVAGGSLCMSRQPS